MSKVRQLPPQRRVILALALLASAIVACDRGATAPADIRPAPFKPAATIEGDTTSCLRGWVIIAGAYSCK